jgi:hypothetical protein
MSQIEIAGWDSFLVETPPGQWRSINDLFRKINAHGGTVRLSSLLFHCPQCREQQFFDPRSGDFEIGTHTYVNDPTKANTSVRLPQNLYTLLQFQCRICDAKKVIAARLEYDDETKGFKALKFGEDPPFGERLPSRLISLIGPDRELFLKGQRCERQALGIAAYSYYRRVVENQWSRLIGSIETVALKLNASSDVLKAINWAKANWRFGDAVDSLKDAVPSQLLVKGQNPLILLYRPLSKGLHELSDEECLTLAQSIRVVLAKLAENMAAALADDAELGAAVNKLSSALSSASPTA